MAAILPELRYRDVIKIMATGGNMTPTLGPHESQYTRNELTAAVDEAHAHGLRLAAHAHAAQGIADAMAREQTRSSTARSSRPTESTPTPTSSISSPAAAQPSP